MHTLMFPIRWICVVGMIMVVNCHVNYLLFNLLLINYRLNDNKLMGD
jgi:hypothetical protein